jgi:hypothetical protein
MLDSDHRWDILFLVMMVAACVIVVLIILYLAGLTPSQQIDPVDFSCDQPIKVVRLKAPFDFEHFDLFTDCGYRVRDVQVDKGFVYIIFEQKRVLYDRPDEE